MKQNKIILLLALIIFVLKINAQGLFFQNPLTIKKRTSYSVFNENAPKFKHKLSIDYDMQLPRDEGVGYIMRITDKPNNMIFNMFFDGRGNDYFEFNEEGRISLLKYHFDRNVLRNKLWFHMSLVFDLDNKYITLIVDGKSMRTRLTSLPNTFAPNIVFGRSEYLIDVPAFKIKNLVVKDNDDTYSFPLNHTHGTDVYTKEGRKMGSVINPYWSINDSFHWKHIVKIASSHGAGVNYDSKRHNLYCYNRDSLYVYNTASGNYSRHSFINRCPVDIKLGMSFLDESLDRLYTYEAFTEHKPAEAPSVASLDLNDYSWRVESNTQIDEGQMHHHGGFYNSKGRQFMLYGGFAAMKYSNTFYSYLLDEHRWQMHHDIKGKPLPRYYVSMGYDGKRYAYVFGGMGNESGDQTVGRRYFYDLYRLDLNTMNYQKMWETKWTGERNVVPVRGMLIEGNYFYTLCYSEFLSDSSLKLYRFSLKDGSYEQLGDSIQIHSDRIETNANIYYDSQQRAFIATVQQFTNVSSSVVNVYRIDTPVLSEKEYAEVAALPSDGKIWIWIIAAIVLLCGGGAYVWYRLKKRSQARHAIHSAAAYRPNVRANAVYLFGEFMVRDRMNRDITYMFTDKLKQVLCLIIQFSNDDGISSRSLGNIMWGDKPAEKIKNSRSVTINHLRKVLTELDGIKVLYSNNHFKISYGPEFYCDYIHMRQLDEMAENKETTREMMSILKRGKFLNMLDMPTLDSFKSDTEHHLLPKINVFMVKAYDEMDFQLSLECADIIFNIDPFNEKAFNYKMKCLKKMNKTSESRETIRQFKESYNKNFGEDYSSSES